MNQTYINELKNHIGEEVTLKGWLYNSRSSGKLVFLQLRDGTGIVQCVVFKGNDGRSFRAGESARAGIFRSSCTARSKKTRARQSAWNSTSQDLEVLQNAHEYPITPKEHGTEFLMDNRHLWIRSKKQNAVLKIRHTVIKASRDFLDDNGFILADTPIFTPAACEGTTTLFEVDYFDDDKAYLTQSGQLYNEATAAAFGRSYAFGPVFRAEKSKTRRHLTEFWMVEPEMAYAQLDDVMTLGEGLINYIVERVLNDRQEELKVLERDVSKLEAIPAQKFPRVHYDEAVKILQEGFAKGELENNFEWGGDFGAPDETYISKQFDAPVFVHHFPAVIKAFYFERDADASRTGSRRGLACARRLRRNHRRRRARD